MVGQVDSRSSYNKIYMFDIFHLERGGGGEREREREREMLIDLNMLCHV